MKRLLRSLVLAMTVLSTATAGAQSTVLKLPAGSRLKYESGPQMANYTDAEESTLAAGLSTGDKGLMWYNTDDQAMKYWDGSAVVEIPTSIPPSFQYVVEADDFASLPSPGVADTIYITKDNNNLYRWGTAEIAPDPGSYDWIVDGSGGGDFLTLQAALADAGVVNGDTIQIKNGTYAVSATINVNKQVSIYGESKAGVILETAGAGSDPVAMVNISVDNVIVKNLTLKHKKTTNTSVEAVIQASGGGFPQTRVDNITIDSVRIEFMEFGAVFRASDWIMSNSEFVYTGPTNSTRRAIGVYGNLGNSFVYQNTFDNGSASGNLRFVQLTSTTGTNPNETYSGALVIEGNEQTANALQQFFNQDSWQGSANDFQIQFKNNTTLNDSSAFVVFFGAVANFGDILSEVTLSGNTANNGGGKGLVAVDGSGAIAFRSSALPFHASGNTATNTGFLGAYVTATGVSPAYWAGYNSTNISSFSVTQDAVIPTSPSFAGYVQLATSYTPAVPANWSSVPSTISGALDELAANLVGKLSNSLTSAQIFVGNGSNVATGVAMSGEATIANTGAITLSNSAVIGKVLTGLPAGTNTPILATDSILQAMANLQAQISGATVGANTSLSNLTSPTAINQDLIASDTTKVLGSSATEWAAVYARALVNGNGSSPLLEVKNIVANTAGADVEVKTANNSSGEASGDISLLTGNNNNPAGGTGAIKLVTGDAANASLVGDITLQAGGATAKGEILFVESSLAGASNGYVWTLANNSTGQGGWAAPSGLSSSLTDSYIFVGNGSNVATGVAMSGEASLANTGAITLDNGAVIGKVLTGFTAGAGTVAATDTILQAIQKLAGNDGLYIPLAGSSAITGSLVPQTTNSINLGSGPNRWASVFASSFIASGGGTGVFRTSSQTAASNSGLLLVASGDVESGTSGEASFRSGDASVTTGVSGNANYRSGNVVDGTSGNVVLKSGNATGTGSSGNVQISAGTVVSGTRGNVSINANGVTVSPGSAGMSLSSQKIVSLADPTAAQDAATKNYVDVVAKLQNNGTYASPISITDSTGKVDPAYTGNQWRKIMFVVGNGGPVAPDTTEPVDGCDSSVDAYKELVIIGTSATNTVTLSTTGNLVMKATTVLGDRGSVSLVCDGAYWVEM